MSKLSEVIKDINKKYKCEVVTANAYAERDFGKKVPFVTPALNYSLYGGLPRGGKLIQIAGEEGGGKSTLAESISGMFQKVFEQEYNDEVAKLQEVSKPTIAQKTRLAELMENGKQKVLWIDAEWTFDPDWAELNGMSMGEDCLFFVKPDLQPAESIFDMIRELVNTGAFGLVVLDSIGVLQSKKDLESSYEDASYGGIAKSLGRFSKDMVQSCAKYNMLFIGINQLRDNLKSTYGGTTSVGGRGWRHNVSLKIELRRDRFIDENYKELTMHPEQVQGNIVACEFTKNKICRPDRRLCKWTINYTSGLDYYYDTFMMAIALGILEQSGAWYAYNDENGNPAVDSDGTVLKFQGATKIIEYLKTHEDFTQTLIKKIEEKTV